MHRWSFILHRCLLILQKMQFCISFCSICINVFFTHSIAHILPMWNCWCNVVKLSTNLINWSWEFCQNNWYMYLMWKIRPKYFCHSQISFYFTYISMPFVQYVFLGRVKIEQKSRMLLTEFPLNLIKLKGRFYSD